MAELGIARYRHQRGALQPVAADMVGRQVENPHTGRHAFAGGLAHVSIGAVLGEGAWWARAR